MAVAKKKQSMTYAGGAKKRSIGEKTVKNGMTLQRKKAPTMIETVKRATRSGGVTGPMQKREKKAQKIR